MEREIPAKLAAFNRIYKEMDIMYHHYAKKCALSDAAMWILYSVIENEKSFTQRELCGEWSFPPQTVNSALKDLERKNFIVLEQAQGNKKNKFIKLTKEGKELTERTVIPLMKAECDTFNVLSAEESDIMLALMQRYTAELKERISALGDELKKE